MSAKDEKSEAASFHFLALYENLASQSVASARIAGSAPFEDISSAFF